MTFANGLDDGCSVYVFHCSPSLHFIGHGTIKSTERIAHEVSFVVIILYNVRSLDAVNGI